jgi:hypothetical protein
MSDPRYRLIAGAAAFVVATLILSVGCNAKRATIAGPKGNAASTDPAAAALATLETTPGFANCRDALQQLDNHDDVAGRPTLSDADKTELVALLRLTPAEAAEIGQTSFTPTDAAYLEEALLVRSGVRSLRIDGRPPLERARTGFDWVCRMVFPDDRVPWPANVWSTLEGGSGISLSRAYVVLATWQQLGLDGCLVGPPTLKKTASYGRGPTGRLTYAPVRACGVAVDGKVYLFDPATGLPLTGTGGAVLTLAAARQAPDSAKGFEADEVKTWQPFLAPPLGGLGRRMEWLEQRNPGGAGVRLFVNPLAQRAKFGGPACDAWDPDGDSFSASRVLSRYVSDEPVVQNGPPVREAHRFKLLPLDRLPKTNLSAGYLIPAFARPFEELRWGPNTPRDQMLRGQFAEAMSVLADKKSEVDNARTRMDQDKGLQADFEKWVDQFQALTARVLRPDPSDPNGAQAQQALDEFRRSRHSQDMERAFVLGHAARPLGAEVTYLTAQCVHERAERARLEGSSQAPAQWRNAAEWWQRFLDASSEAASPVPARETQARALLARARQFAGK